MYGDLTHIYDGILAIGDQHITSTKPSKRKDINYLDVVIDKLKQSLDIAKEKNLFPVLLGDLLDNHSDYGTIVPLNNLLLNKNIYCNLGNHDIPNRLVFNIKNKIPARKEEEDKQEHPLFVDGEMHIPINKKSVIAILQSSKCITVFNKISNIKVKTKKGNINIKFVPYGIPIPENFNNNDGEANLMVTHHDINFGTGLQYANSFKVFPVTNCDMVVNGHMHNYVSPQEVGNTLWCNPGSIIRNTKSLRKEKPSVSEIKINEKEINKLKINRIFLEFKDDNDVFDDSPIDFESHKSMEMFRSQFVENLDKSLCLEDEQLNGDNIDDLIREHLKENPQKPEVNDYIFYLKNEIEDE